MTTINQQMSNILETAKSIGDFKMLMRVVEAASLTDTLKSSGPFTVFAPSDEAFLNLPTGMLDEWLKDPTKLRNIVTYHVVDHKITKDELHRLTGDGRLPTVATLQGSTVVLKTQGRFEKTEFVNDAKIIKSDIETTNGVIHIIDRVLVPPVNQGMQTSNPEIPAPTSATAAAETVQNSSAPSSTTTTTSTSTTSTTPSPPSS
jgi:uncharacterized surface protein with fasciclin (FAS1) repeats